MKPIKIYGEAKTATTYLEKLIETNTNATLCSNGVGSALGWKHGFPIPGDATYIFLMRDPFEWVKSYLADPSDARFEGLRKPFGNRKGYKYQKHWGWWDHMMQCRNFKYKAYKRFAKEYGGIIIKSEYLKENPDCISMLRRYHYEVGRPIKDFSSHVYKDVRGKDDPNRKPLTKSQREWIRKQDQVGFVGGLTIQAFDKNIAVASISRD